MKKPTIAIMKLIFILLTIFTTTAQAQDFLIFDKRYVESEDRWVAFEKDSSNSFMYGFIYIDAQAGLTLNYEGSFTISSTGAFVPKKIDSVGFKVRLQPNNVLVAFIPENKFNELKIPVVPEWLKYYKTDTASAVRLYRWGYMYNGWNECAKGLSYLEKAQKADPKLDGLLVEMAFSYNCLQQYDKAVTVLQEALKIKPTDAYVYKELVYAYVKSGQLDMASESCKKAIEVCPDRSHNGENCYNLLSAYYRQKGKANFNAWLAEAKKWLAGKEELLASVKAMEEEMRR
jgi:tetratricopeptide (TPR) repeat protein